ncbi:MAG TPA: DUF1559 domain-containing protein [Planctomycetaceae bacterium]|nr:DUF1559 domain-containing protein [Planctomycetaceae bacterium]
MSRRGFSLVELVVVLATIGLLLALILPAVGSVREAARRTQCRANLKQLGLALHNYESQFGMLPSATMAGLSWHVSILPFIEQRALYDQVDYTGRLPSADRFRHVPISLYLCPSDSAPPVSGSPDGSASYAATSYLGCSGTGALSNGFDGLFVHHEPYQPDFFPGDGPIRLAAITDGLSQTAAVAEIQHTIFLHQQDRLRTMFNTPLGYDRSQIAEFRRVCLEIPDPPSSGGWTGPFVGHGLPWTTGSIGYSTYNHVLTPQQPSCLNQTHVPTGIFTAGSQHGDVVHVLFADGHVQVLGKSVDYQSWMDMGSRSGRFN